jgi:replicative superfamily II helicase
LEIKIWGFVFAHFILFLNVFLLFLLIKAGLGCVVSILGSLDSHTSNQHLFMNSHIIISSVETFEALSRKWKMNVKGKSSATCPQVCLFIFDHLHLVNNDTFGPLYESCVFRIRQFYGEKFICYLFYFI